RGRRLPTLDRDHRRGTLLAPRNRTRRRGRLGHRAGDERSGRFGKRGSGGGRRDLGPGRLPGVHRAPALPLPQRDRSSGVHLAAVAAGRALPAGGGAPRPRPERLGAGGGAGGDDPGAADTPGRRLRREPPLRRITYADAARAAITASSSGAVPSGSPTWTTPAERAEATAVSHSLPGAMK